MGTMKRRAPEPEAPSYTSLVASAARVNSSINGLPVTGRDRAWQGTAYQMYKDVGEFRYACDWVGSMMSKAVLFPTKRERAGVIEPILDGTPRAYMDDLFNHPDGRAEMLRLIGIHLTIAGECYLVGYDNPDPLADDSYTWEVVSPLKITRQGGATGRWRVNNEVIDVDPDNVLVIRIWRQDPEDSRFAMAPSRSLLPVLGEILRLTQHVAAQVDSRLAGAGILLMPNEMTFPPPPESVDSQGNTVIHHHDNDAESLMSTITEAMSASIKDRASASALVPIVITAPAEAISAVKHLTFWSELDSQAIELRTEAIRRLALGMDMPPEVLQGNTDANHWSAWQADESAIKSHTEPLLKIISSSIAQGYLRPMLKADGMEFNELRDYSVGADTSEMRLRPNRSKEAFELFDRGAISQETLRRETGFTVEDAMNDKERTTWFLEKVASGSTTPELVSQALQAIGVPIGTTTPENATPTETGGERTAETQEARPTPTLKEHPERALPDEHRNSQARESKRRRAIEESTGALVAAAEQLTIRAFERAGNKLKNRMQTKPRVPASELYSFVAVGSEDVDFLLEDAWAHLPPVAKRYGVEPATLEPILHQYAHDALVNAKPHSFERFDEHVKTSLEATTGMTEAKK